MKDFERRVTVTADGSTSLYLPELDEHYHSIHGALQEALHVFIQMGYRWSEREEIHVLEIGFGTGLNAVLTLLEQEKDERNVSYHGLEAYPIKVEELDQLNFPGITEEEQKQETLMRMHALSWGDWNEIVAGFQLKKEQVKLEDWSAPDSVYDLIYFDAFGPRVQPNLWTDEIMNKMYRTVRPGGALVTYCAKGAVKRSLKQAGFAVESLPGPPGKREMTRAIKLAN